MLPKMNKIDANLCFNFTFERPQIMVVFCLVLLFSCQLSEEKKEATVLEKTENSFISISAFVSKVKGETDYVLVEVSKEKEYQKGHLPKAQNIWRKDFNATDDVWPFGGMMGSRERITELANRLGVGAETNLYLYDARGGCEASRVKWIFERYGFKDVYIIDGGKQAWVENGQQLSINPVEPPKQTDFVLKGEDLSKVASLEEVLAAITDTNTLLVDTRTLAEFEGIPYLKKGKRVDYNPSGFCAGRIPTAIHFDWGNAVCLKTNHTLKSILDLEAELAKKGISKDKNIIAYCQSGTRSSHTTTLLTEVLNYPNVKNYDGSWIEWSYHYVNNPESGLEIERN